jgi:hypothetical protein
MCFPVHAGSRVLVHSIDSIIFYRHVGAHLESEFFLLFFDID